MTSYLSQFHYVASQVPAQFDMESENFNVSQIYQHYALKHERTPVSLFMDRMFAGQLAKVSTDATDYESLYVQTKKLAQMCNQKMQ